MASKRFTIRSLMILVAAAAVTLVLIPIAFHAIYPDTFITNFWISFGS